jgi:glycogen debranching enzyme
MLAEIPSKEQAARMVEILLNEKYFGKSYPWNTLSRDDKDYNATTGDYWRGGIWLPLAYMGTKALEKYGYYELADSLAKNIIQQQLNTYHSVTPHTIWECYSPSKDQPSTEHGRRARPDFCGWSALGPISLFIENVLGFREISALDETVRWSLKKENGTHGIRNLNFGNIRTDILYNSSTNTIEVTSNGPYTLIVNGTTYRITKGKQTHVN